MTHSKLPIHQISLRIESVAELFNSIDPTPFNHRRLDGDVEDYLESWAMSFPSLAHFRIIIHLENLPQDDPTSLITEAIHHDFQHKTERAQRELTLLLHDGKKSLLIGLGFLTACLFFAQLLPDNRHTLLQVLRESMSILGWVSLWHPTQIFLYGWWPIARKREVRRQLSQSLVQVLSSRPKKEEHSHNVAVQ